MPLPPERARAFEAAGKQGCDCVAWSRKRRTGFISRQGVYELTVVADILVLNSIEFWSGENLVSQSTKEVKGENGDTYLVTTDENGYTITNQKDNTTIGFVFDSNDNSWSVSANGETTKFMTFVDDNHVKMPGVDGNDMIIELSQAGVMAYQEAAQHFNFAMK